MKNRDIFGWIIVGINWYVIIILGGCLNIAAGLLKRLHDLWLILRGENKEQSYYVTHSPKKLGLSFITLILASIIMVLTIFLITPAAMGIQHLLRSVSKGKNRTEILKKGSFKDGKKWYDGIIYSSGVDPGLKEARAVLLKLIPENSRVIDICCGTGELVFSLADKCEYALGMDHSSKMISFAEKKKTDRKHTNVDFSFANAADLSDIPENHFDFSILSLTLHEMAPSVRLEAFKEAMRVSKNLIILDYIIPAPMNKNGITALFFEFVAGYDHLRHYLHYRDNGGLDYLLSEAGLKRQNDLALKNGTLEIVMVSMDDIKS